tara:strand:- start:190 stop:462 length:273 start_codon:yes stop_codon:yes gene_type:complete
MTNTHAEYLRTYARSITAREDWQAIISAAEEIERLERALHAEISERKTIEAYAEKLSAASADYQEKAEAAMASADSLTSRDARMKAEGEA